MKIIPYVRFIWAGFIIINFITQTSFTLDKSGSIGIFSKALTGLFGLTFSTYCIITGLQEVKNKQFIDARFFESFGLVFEVFVFFLGLYILKIFLGQEDTLRITLMTIWQIGLLILVIVDIRRIWTS